MSNVYGLRGLFRWAFPAFALMTCSSVAQTIKPEPPDKLVQAVEYFDTCEQEMQHSLPKAKEWCQKACSTARGFKSKDQEKRAAAGRFLAECDKKMQAIREREDYLGKTAKAAHKAISNKKLATAAHLIEEANPPTEDQRYKLLASDLEGKKSERDGRIRQGDEILNQNPKKALQYYVQAVQMDVEMDLSGKFRQARDRMRNRKARR